MDTATTLVWNVRYWAIRKGYDTPDALAQATAMNRKTVMRIWAPTLAAPAPKMFDVETLRRCADVLHARVPAVFQWGDADEGPPPGWRAEEQAGPPYLHWQVCARCAHQGLDLITFARRAQIFYRTRPESQDMMAERLWAGQHRAITLAVLARVLRVLDASPGDLFVWG